MAQTSQFSLELSELIFEVSLSGGLRDPESLLDDEEDSGIPILPGKFGIAMFGKHPGKNPGGKTAPEGEKGGIPVGEKKGIPEAWGRNIWWKRAGGLIPGGIAANGCMGGNCCPM
ncbi:hypothetical protein FO519_008552 [Halicephalobus sp. NKZ332]|nr:hypothetical protein FO519_008552 [Halicephalobus sp. NKZ332]